MPPIALISKERREEHRFDGTVTPTERAAAELAGIKAGVIVPTKSEPQPPEGLYGITVRHDDHSYVIDIPDKTDEGLVAISQLLRAVDDLALTRVEVNIANFIWDEISQMLRFDQAEVVSNGTQAPI